MAAPLLFLALADLVRHRNAPNQNEQDDANDTSGDEGESHEGREEEDEEDEAYRSGLRRRMKALRLSRENTREIEGPPGTPNRRVSHDGRRADTDAENQGRANSTAELARPVKPEPANRPSSRMSSSNQSQETKSKRPWDRISRILFGAKEGGEEGPKVGDLNYVPPKYRWSPIFSGIVQPFAILLEIPCFTELWYVKYVDGVATVYQENPTLLDVGLGISMACAIIANIALISRFLERRVFVSTIVCIVMLSLHDIINITALIVFGVIRGVDDGFDYSEAFWMCVCSTTASFFVNISLVYDIIRTKQFRYSGSGLTPKQRKLVIIVMMLLVYIAIGALVFNFLIPDLIFQDALYFTVVSIETIGFGDIGPSATGARIFLIFYVPFGIFNLALAVGTARDTLVESWSAAYRRRRHHVLERQRERKQQRIDEAARLAEEDARTDGAESDPTAPGADSERTLTQSTEGSAKNHLAVPPEGPALTTHTSAQDEITGIFGKINEPRETSEAARKRLVEELVELSWENEEGYKTFQERMRHEEKIENLWKFGSAGGLFLTFWLVGAGIFYRTEESWSFFTGLYFCFVTFTTVGYGDVVVTSSAGRAVFIIWAICGVGIVTLLIAVITEAYSNHYKAFVTRNGKKHSALRPSGSVPIIKDPEEVTTNQVEKLPYEILGLLKEWQTHLHVAKLCSISGPNDKEAQISVDEFLAGRSLSESKEKIADPVARMELFWTSYEDSIRRLVSLADQTINHIEENRRQKVSKEESSSSAGEAIPDDLKEKARGAFESQGASDHRESDEKGIPQEPAKT